MSEPKRPLYYSDYLQLDRLLGCQSLESARHGKSVHDEHLFIIVHQAYELWFKQILWELDAVLALFRRRAIDDRDMGRGVAHLRRIVEIQRILLAQIDVLETMTPLDFLDFREYLAPSSGVQSVQFRLVENKLGLPREARLQIEGTPYAARFREEHRALLEESEKQPSLLALTSRWLERTPFLRLGEYDFWKEYRKSVHAMIERERSLVIENPDLAADDRKRLMERVDATAAKFDMLFDRKKHDALVKSGERRLSHEALLAALLINLYRDEPILQIPYRLLTLLMDVDEGFTAWRYRHALMVFRMIGTRAGTGGTSGSDYLRETAERHKVFTDLFNLSTFFIPRSALPKLPPEVERTMSFQFSGESD